MAKTNFSTLHFLKQFRPGAIWAFLLCLSCSSPHTISPSSPNLNDRLSAVIKPQIGTKNIGVIVGIYDKGKIEYLTFGETAKGTKQLPTEDTLFEIGSITKTFTGLLLAQSIELGRVHETDTLDSFRSEWKGQRTGTITLLELTLHKSGLPRNPCNLHYSDPRNPYLQYSEEDLINGLTNKYLEKNCELKTHPTNERHYSNWGVGVLGYALSLQQKKNYETLLKELITQPLGLKNTTITLSPKQKIRLATGYDQDLNQNPPWDHQVLFGAGAIKSSAHDLMIYAKAILHPERTRVPEALRRSKNYAWFTGNKQSLWHDGMTGGFSSLMKIYPSEDMAVFYLSNTARPLSCFIEAVEEIPCEF